jgi:hypothetical protein
VIKDRFVSILVTKNLNGGTTAFSVQLSASSDSSGTARQKTPRQLLLLGFYRGRDVYSVFFF